MSKSNMTQAIEAGKMTDPRTKYISLEELLQGSTDDSKEFAECGISGGLSFQFRDGERIRLVPIKEQKIGGHYFTMRNGKVGRTLHAFFITDRSPLPVEIPLAMFRRVPDCQEEIDDLLQGNDGAQLLNRMFDSRRLALLYQIFGESEIQVEVVNCHHNYYTNEGKFVRDSISLPEESRRPWTCYKFHKVK